MERCESLLTSLGRRTRGAPDPCPAYHPPIALMTTCLSGYHLRPYVIGEQAQLPILLILVGVLGGIQVFGLIGILISPLLIASVLAFAQIYREEYLAEHPEAKVSPDTLTRR